MTVGYFYEQNREFASVGTPLQQRDLKDVVMSLPQLNPNNAKHSDGCIYFHTNNKVGVEFKPVSDGIVCCDIDAISKDDCKKIMDSFEILSIAFPCIVCCWYSNSYYNKNKQYGGLHIVIKTDKDKLEYEPDNGYSYKIENMIYTAILTRVIYKECGIDVRPIWKEDIQKVAGIDKAMLSIGQQCFLNYSEVVKWNDDLQIVHIGNDLINAVKDWFVGYKWFNAEDDYTVVSYNVRKFNSDIVLSDNFNVNKNAFVENQLGHKRRITVENFLAGLGWELDDIVDFMVKICYGNDFANGEAALRRGIKQTAKVAISKYRNNPNAENAEYAKNILSALGVDIEVDVKKIYQPIDYKYDSIFEEVWESLKDAPYHNRYYNPENVLKIKLNSDEYLTDYKHQINEMVYKYDMTYLVADCMVGKTTLGLNMKSSYGLFDSNDFVAHFHGDTIDLCVPYNSVADNKAKATRRDIKRVRTKKLDDFSLDKRNVFIWNTIMPLYEKYFKLGLVKRLVLFFDESQKIVTDDYRWETIFEMFKVLPTMYKHFVFMTGTPAGELEFLKQYFNNYCIINVDKDIDYNRECKILKYSKFGMGDMINLIEEVIADGRLPLIYANAKNALWKSAIRTINLNRLELGLKPYRVCVYDRPNADKLGDVNKSNSIKNYDIVIATKYCSVGIDFIKDDKRMRCAIIDYINERDCTFHDIWQFTLRNRDQDTITKIVVSDDVASYQNKLYNYWYYVQLFDDIAKIHTYKMVKPTYENEIDVKNFEFIQDVFQIRKFGKLVNGNKHYFDDDKNVKLLSIYYLYVKIFSNINIIKHMLQRRGVVITEIDMEHTKMKMDYTNKKNIYNGFVENFTAISNIESNRSKFDNRSYQTDINDNTLPDLYIEDNRIYSSNMHYTDWLIGQFAGKEEWLPILQERDYITKETFATYNRILMIAKKITKREIDRIKRLGQYLNELDLEDLVASMVAKHYSGIIDITKNDIYKCMLLREVITDYDKILRFIIDNVEFIEDVKNAIDNGDKISAVHKMKITMEQKEQERIRRLQSEGAKKRNSKSITVRWRKTGEVVTYDTMEALATAVGHKKQNLKRAFSSQNSAVHKMIEIVSPMHF